jgi:hypothetical protein
MLFARPKDAKFSFGRKVEHPLSTAKQQLESSCHQLISANNECSDLTVVLSGRPPILGKTPMLKKAFLLGVVALAGVGMVRA